MHNLETNIMQKFGIKKCSILLFTLIVLLSFTMLAISAESLNQTDCIAIEDSSDISVENDVSKLTVEDKNSTVQVDDNLDVSKDENDNSNDDLALDSYTEVSDDSKDILSSQSGKKTIFFISDNSGTNILDAAAIELLDNGLDVNLVIRSGEQIKDMPEDELYALLDNSDAFIGEWISTDVDAVLTSLIGNYPALAQKDIFLILEPPSGKLSSTSTSIDLLKKNVINGVKIFDGFTNEEIVTYFTLTKRGTAFEDIIEFYETDFGSRFNSIFNNIVLYKDINNKDNLKGQILYILNNLGLDVEYSEPTSDGTRLYGIYRDKWYSLEDYKAEFFDSSKTRIACVLESTMYVNSNALQPCYEIVEQLESKGFNVIPVFAAGATKEQLMVMVETFTTAPTYQEFLADPSKYDVNLDAIVSMVAYGVGGETFANTTDFFEEAGVPVFRAVHSDYVSNAQWELSSTGLTTTMSDKWWHVSIAEAQGIIDATFIGGAAKTLSQKTGALITGYSPHHENINLLTDRISSWVDLRYTLNDDKVLSIIYYNYPPGKQNIGSSYLDSITSIYNMLYTLKEAGYNVGELPKNVSELENEMIRCGINVANWAPGELQKLADQPGITLLPVDEYVNWYNTLDDIVKIQVSEGPVAYIAELTKRAVELQYTVTIGDTIDDWYNQIAALLPENNTVMATEVLKNIVASLKQYASTGSYSDYQIFEQYYAEFKSLNISGLNGWGEAPGNIMMVNRNGTDYFVIPGLTFGNIFVAPEPQRGWESDVENLYHCTAVAPTHQYLAAYYYMQSRYSNAMIFVGRHGTHEWLPGKEILLSYNDYGSIVVGDVPQLYFYITDGLGEAIQAKRRGFAVMISHLTSPMAYTQLYGNLTASAKIIEEYENTFDETMKKVLAEELRGIVIDNLYYGSFGLSENETKALSDADLVSYTNTFLKEMQNTLYPLGLHAIGEMWSEKDVANTVSVMISRDFDLPGNKGTTNLYKILSNHYYSKDYEDLTAFEREAILNKSYDICKALIYWDADAVYSTLSIDENNLLECLNQAKKYINLINESIANELNSMLKGLEGKYIPIGYGGDLIATPGILPTGYNMFQDQSAELPTTEAYEYAKTLALLTLADLDDETEKIIMGIWCVETARDDGALVSTVLYLLGMQVKWHPSASAGVDDEGYVTGMKTEAYPEVVPLDDLVRPEGWAKKRIDVSVITSGLFRDLYSSQAVLMDNAFRMTLACSYNTIKNNRTLIKTKEGAKLLEALEFVMEGINYQGIGSESLEDNYVAKHWVEDCLYYLSIGYNATYAGECAITRIFAPPNGDYGAGISKLVQMSWTWNDTSELADFYLGRMGNMYSKNYWGDTNPIVFFRALSNADTIVASRNTNQYGVLDNDDFFDYWGGLSMTVEQISGKTPKMNILMYADKAHPYVKSLEEVMNAEITARYDNPEWIKGMMNEGYSGARYISNKFVTNLFGWQVTRPSAVSDELWKKVYDTYYGDKYGIGVNEWLKSGNNAYSLISMSGTMLTAIKEGYWNADDATIRDIANTWAQATVQNGVACCDCSCGNVAMMQWAITYVNADILAKLLPKLYEATQNPVFQTNASVEPSQSDADASTPNPQKGSDATSTVETNSSSTSSTKQSSTGSTSSGNGVGVDGSQPSTGMSQGTNGAGESAASQDGKKAAEINPVVTKSSSDTGLSILAVLAVIGLVIIIGLGYIRNKDEEKEEVVDFDYNYNFNE